MLAATHGGGGEPPGKDGPGRQEPGGGVGGGGGGGGEGARRPPSIQNPLREGTLPRTNPLARFSQPPPERMTAMHQTWVQMKK